MTMLASIIISGESVSSATKLMLSLVSFWFIIMVASQLVNSSPMTDRLTRRTAREDHQANPENPEINRISSDLFLKRKSFNFFNGVKFPDTVKDLKWTHSEPSTSYSYDPSTPAYFGPKLIYKEFVYYKRRKRELRTSSKVSSSSSSNVPSKSSYHPFLMAEMISGSVKTRHPSIIAVNGCPAYYIADHKGQCRQVFQYTVNFGQRLPNFHNNPTPSPPKHTIHLKNFFLHKEQNPQFSTTTLSPEIPNTPGKPIPVVQTPQSPPSPSPRLLMLLRNAAKRFDLSFLKNQGSSSSSSSSNSGETTNEDKIDKLRRKILSALKITKNKEFSKDEPKKIDKDRRNSNSNPSSTTTTTTSTTTSTTSTSTTTTTTTTPDYDD